LQEHERLTQQIEEFGEECEAMQEIGDNIALLDLWTEKDALIATLEASKENVDAKIGEKENEIIKAITEEWRKIFT